MGEALTPQVVQGQLVSSPEYLVIWQMLCQKKDISRVTYNFLERFAYVTCGIKPEFDYNIILVCHPEWFFVMFSMQGENVPPIIFIWLRDIP